MDFLTKDNIIGEKAEIIPGEIYFCVLKRLPDHTIENIPPFIYLIDEDNAYYYSFFEDFGPYNLSVLYRFCKYIKERAALYRNIFICCGSDEKDIVNAAYLVGSYAILAHNLLADVAYLRVRKVVPNGFIGFIDAAEPAPLYRLHLHDVLLGVEKALRFKWFSLSTFDLERYEYYEKVENGDLNWIIPNKILSFCGPRECCGDAAGYPVHSPETYFQHFRSTNVTTVIRLNEPVYDSQRFVKAGFQHLELFFPDGCTPPEQIIKRFIYAVDSTRGAVAVHCKAGLGRTGTLIACWMMKQFQITAAECMAWIRICRPGSIIGPQQKFLIRKQSWCHELRSKMMLESASSTRNLEITPSKIPRPVFSTLVKKVHSLNICENNIDMSRSSTSSNSELSCSRSELLNTAFDETFSADFELKSQGDRLLEKKVEAQKRLSLTLVTQSAISKPSTSKSTAISKSAKKTKQTRRSPRITSSVSISAVPISRVTVMASNDIGLQKSSKNAKRLSDGPSSVPSKGLGVQSKSTRVYDLRRRRKVSDKTSSDIAATLPRNTKALIGTRRLKKTK